MLPGYVRAFGIRIDRALRTIPIVEKAHPAAPHFHLAVLGTDPDHQGKGLGAAVIAPMLERCDREGVPAYLESSNPRNIPFYARHGFVESDPIPLIDGCPPVTPMWREPRS
jgi:GNAT superfamily N-acetyltransferase